VSQDLHLDSVRLTLDLAQPFLSPQSEDRTPHEAQAVPHLPTQVLFLQVIQLGFPVVGIVFDFLDRR
jgi:hypothetical protein